MREGETAHLRVCLTDKLLLDEAFTESSQVSPNLASLWAHVSYTAGKED